MQNGIIYDSFMSEKKLLHSDTVKNYNEGLLYFIENKQNVDGITFNKVDKFLLFNIGILEIDENNNYYYEHSVSRDADIVDNIRYESEMKNVSITYYIGGILYQPSDVKEFILISAPYHEFKVRITFLEKPSTDAEFKIHSRVYLLGTEHRKKIANNTVITNNILYRNGICEKR